jgi:hypothetical protein
LNVFSPFVLNKKCIGLSPTLAFISPATKRILFLFVFCIISFTFHKIPALSSTPPLFWRVCKSPILTHPVSCDKTFVYKITTINSVLQFLVYHCGMSMLKRQPHVNLLYSYLLSLCRTYRRTAAGAITV